MYNRSQQHNHLVCWSTGSDTKTGLGCCSDNGPKISRIQLGAGGRNIYSNGETIFVGKCKIYGQKMENRFNSPCIHCLLQILYLVEYSCKG